MNHPSQTTSCGRFSRRDFVVGGAALALTTQIIIPASGAENNIVSFSGFAAQGGLVVGRVSPGSKAAGRTLIDAACMFTSSGRCRTRF